MSSLRDIRLRLRSIENIKKITDTMERVAAARLRHAQSKAEQSRFYIKKLKEILEKVASTGVNHHELFRQRDVKKTGIVIVAADRGLSGSYNATVFHAADKFLKQYHPEDVELILIGKKAVEYYSRTQWTIREKITQILEKQSYGDVDELSERLVKWFLSGGVDEIWLVYTHYLSVINRRIEIEKFLNIGKYRIEKHKKIADYIFEPRSSEILAELLPRYCKTRLQTAFFEAYASELGARIVAMQTASKNSEEMIKELTLIKNKTRQRDITKEMIEITSGSEGIK